MERATGRLGDGGKLPDLVFLLVLLSYKHLELKKSLEALEAAADRADRVPDVLTAAYELRRLKQPLLAFMHMLEQYASWKKEKLDPLMTAALGRIENDYKLGIADLQAFLQRLDDFGARPHACRVAEAIGGVLQGCLLLKEHFRTEEHALFLLVEQMLSDSNSGRS